MVGLWLSLVASYAALLAVLGGPFAVALPFAVIIASLTVMLASLVRLVFACSEARALIGGVAAMCVLFLVFALAGAERADLNARIGESAIWIDGGPTGAGAVGLATTMAAIALVSLVAYAASRLVARLLRRRAD